jgi:hypothetical protein
MTACKCIVDGDNDPAGVCGDGHDLCDVCMAEGCEHCAQALEEIRSHHEQHEAWLQAQPVPQAVAPAFRQAHEDRGWLLGMLEFFAAPPPGGGR